MTATGGGLAAPSPDLMALDLREWEPGPGTRSASALNRTDLNPGLDLASIPQDQNYTPAALFTKTHGEFMLAREAWRPDIQASLMGMSDVEVNGEAGDFNLRHARADIQRRIYISDPDSVITVGAQYGQRDYDFKSAFPNGTHDETLYRATLTLNYGRFIDENTLVEVEFMPGVWSDMSSSLNHEDWQFYGKAMATWRYSRDLFFVAGVEHFGLFRDLDVYPLAGLSWLPDSQWRVDVLLPRRARVTFMPNPETSFWFSLDLDGGDFEIETPGNGGSPVRQREVSVQELTASVGGEHRMNANLSFFGEIGSLLGGHYTFRSDGPQVYNGQVEAQIFANVGFGWTF